MRTLSIRQPWAWLIAHGYKDVENRSWSTTYRGWLLIHASKTVAKRDYREVAEQVHGQFGLQVPELDAIERGGIVGLARLSDCVRESGSPWFTGEFGFVLRPPRVLPFHACKGGLSFFHTSAAAVGLDEREVLPWTA